MPETRTFTVEFGGQCQLCFDWVPQGAQAHYVNGKFAHDFCHEDTNGRRYQHNSDEREDIKEPSYTVKGRRNHEKRCGICFLTHAGDCP